MIRDMNSGWWAKGKGVKGVLRPKLELSSAAFNQGLQPPAGPGAVQSAALSSPCRAWAWAGLGDGQWTVGARDRKEGARRGSYGRT